MPNKYFKTQWLVFHIPHIHFSTKQTVPQVDRRNILCNMKMGCLANTTLQSYSSEMFCQLSILHFLLLFPIAVREGPLFAMLSAILLDCPVFAISLLIRFIARPPESVICCGVDPFHMERSFLLNLSGFGVYKCTQLNLLIRRPLNSSTLQKCKLNCA